MAGHSKWKNIRLHKGKADAERGKLFGKLSREITVAAKTGGGSTDANPRLRLAVEKAREASMPADNIKRAIQKGTGELTGDASEEITYEGYGPGGAAVLVETETDNRNRTVEKVRTAFSKNGGSMGESGSVAWQFERKGVLSVPAEGTDEDALLEAALEAGADEVELEGDEFSVQTSPETVSSVQNALEAAGFKVSNIEVGFIPSNTIELSGDNATRMLRLIDVLEELDDVTNVSANFELAEGEEE
ncbi:YebC/PmpR family DNA-binding transcriptional regulator [bacterium]|nr:MAG: YebC/PmpR family DNA-binding transcriptional regulator [bacterium]